MAWYDQVVHPDCPSEPQLTTAGPNVATCAGTHPEPLQAENRNYGVRCSSRERALHAPYPEPCSEHNWGLPVPGGDADVAPESPVDELSEKHKLILIKREVAADNEFPSRPSDVPSKAEAALIVQIPPNSQAKFSHHQRSHRNAPPKIWAHRGLRHHHCRRGWRRVTHSRLASESCRW